MIPNHVTCKGSIFLGSACLQCSKCKKEVADFVVRYKKLDKWNDEIIELVSAFISDYQLENIDKEVLTYYKHEFEYWLIGDQKRRKV